MGFIAKIDTVIYYLLLLYALASSISIAAANIAISLAAVLAIVRYYKESLPMNFDKGLGKAIGIFLVAALLSAVFAYKPNIGFERVGIYFYRMIPLVLAILFIKSKEQLIKILIVMASSILIADCYAIWQGLHGNYRANGFGASPMVLAGYLIQMIPLLLIVGLENGCISLQKKAFLLSGAILSCVALIYNGTRGAWIAVVVTLFLYGLLHIKRNKKAVTIFLAGIIFIGMLAFNTPLIKERVQTITDMQGQSNAERILLWKSSWHMFQDHPLVGVGAGNFVEVYRPYYISSKAKEPELGHAHNNFFQMLAETGAIGLSAFVYMFGYILVTMYRRYSQNYQDIWALVAVLVTISLLTQGLTEYNFGNSAVSRMYWFILGLAYVGLPKNEKQV